VGKSRIDKYGDRFLQKLHSLWSQDVTGVADEANTHHP